MPAKAQATIADQFAADRRYIERRRIYVYAAIAYASVGDMRSALPYANKAVSVVQLGHDDDSGGEAAYSTRGRVLALSGNMEGGDEDLLKAEAFARNLKNSFLLKQDLQFHAEVLKQMNRPDDARAKLEEAARLNKLFPILVIGRRGYSASEALP